MNPQNVLRALAITPFALALVLAGCGSDGDGTLNVTIDDPVIDTVPPGVPTNISVEQVDADLVIRWDENSEPDLAGYVLQVSLDRGATWTDVSGALLTSATYVDTFHNRAEYRVSAEDASSNRSAFSDETTWMITSGGGGKWNQQSADPGF